MRRLILIVLALVALGVAALFTWLNPGSVTVDVAFAAVTVPIAIAFVVTLALGWVLGWLSTVGYLLSLLREQRRLRVAARLAERELDALRAVPPTEGTPPPA